MTPDAKAALLKEFPNHWFCRVVFNGIEAMSAIPKTDAVTPIPGMPGLDVEMLHGATVRITT